MDFGHQAAGWRRRGLLREITGVEDVVHRGAVLAVVEQLVMLGILHNNTININNRTACDQQVVNGNISNTALLKALTSS